MIKLSSSCDICVFSESLLSGCSLVRGEHKVSHLKWEREGKGFNFDLGMNRLKGRLGNCRWTGFRVGNFVGCIDIGVVELGDSVIFCFVEISV